MNEHLEPENEVKYPKFLFRGYCTECNWKGEITKWQSAAQKDAKEHENQYGHKTDVVEIDVPDVDSRVE